MGAKLKNFLLVSLPAVLVFLCAAELLFRVVPSLKALTEAPGSRPVLAEYGKKVSLYEPNLDTKVDFLTGTARYTFQTDAFGLRSRNVAREKPPGTLRILCVGDSFTEGFGVNQEQSFPNRLDAILQGVGVKAQVLCAARAGANIWDYVGILHYYGDLLRPDVVILALYSGNDIDPTMLNKQGRVYDVASYGFLIPRSMSRGFRSNTTFGAVYFAAGRTRIRALDGWLWRHSRVYRFVSDRVFRSKGPVHLLVRLGLVRVEPKIEPLKLPVLNMDTDLYATRGPGLEAARLLYGSTEKAYRNMVEYTRKNGMKLLVLNIPEDWQDPVWSFQIPHFTARHDRNKVHNFFLSLNRKYGVPYRDLLPIYKAAWERRTYSVFDLAAPHGHFSVRDNEMVAFILLDTLMDRGILKVDSGRLSAYYREHFPDVVLPFPWAQHSGAGSGGSNG